MATSTLIQKLDRVTDPLVAGTVGSTVGTMDRAQTEWFQTSSAITAGDWVQFDVALAGLSLADRVLFVKTAAATALGNPLTCGVALASVTGTAAAPKRVQVVVAGLVSSAKVAAGTAQGAPLCGAVAAAGTGLTNVAANIAPVCGVALEAEGTYTAGFAPAWVIKQF